MAISCVSVLRGFILHARVRINKRHSATTKLQISRDWWLHWRMRWQLPSACCAAAADRLRGCA
jgi:hypothetical protein